MFRLLVGPIIGLLVAHLLGPVTAAVAVVAAVAGQAAALPALRAVERREDARAPAAMEDARRRGAVVSGLELRRTRVTASARVAQRLLPAVIAALAAGAFLAARALELLPAG